MWKHITELTIENYCAVKHPKIFWKFYDDSFYNEMNDLLSNITTIKK